MDQDRLIERLAELVEDLSFDYDRMSQSGKKTYNEIMSIVAILAE